MQSFGVDEVAACVFRKKVWPVISRLVTFSIMAKLVRLVQSTVELV